jgi:hypothetical protein
MFDHPVMEILKVIVGGAEVFVAYDKTGQLKAFHVNLDEKNGDFGAMTVIHVLTLDNYGFTRIALNLHRYEPASSGPEYTLVPISHKNAAEITIYSCNSAQSSMIDIYSLDGTNTLPEFRLLPPTTRV